MSNRDESQFDPKQLFKWGGVLLAVIVGMIFLFNSYVNVKATEIAVVQYPFSGKMEVYSSPGTHVTYWGHVTIYQKSVQYWFDGKEGHAATIPVKFYDGGHADIPGSVRVSLPLDAESMIKIQTIYGSEEAVEKDLVGQVLAKSVYMAGPTMTSKEAYAEKKTNLLFYVEDQALHGVYKTTQREAEVVDPFTNQKRVVTVVDILKDSSGLPARVEKSQAELFHVGLSNLTFGDFSWDAVVKDQIAVQQKATAQVQTAIAKAKEAEQEAITTQQQGIASAAKAEWDQKTENAKIIAEAEGRKLAAQQDALAAESEKKAKELRGEGEAAYKRLVTQANNNFDTKVEAWKYAQHEWAVAFGNYKGAIVPQWQQGGPGSGANGATEFMNLMNMKAARDLGLDMNTK